VSGSALVSASGNNPIELIDLVLTGTTHRKWTLKDGFARKSQKRLLFMNSSRFKNGGADGTRTRDLRRDRMKLPEPKPNKFTWYQQFGQDAKRQMMTPNTLFSHPLVTQLVAQRSLCTTSARNQTNE